MIAIGSDHGGFELKQKVIAHLKEQGKEVKDFGGDRHLHDRHRHFHHSQQGPRHSVRPLS